jgi:hypothetical protein
MSAPVAHNNGVRPPALHQQIQSQVDPRFVRLAQGLIQKMFELFVDSLSTLDSDFSKTAFDFQIRGEATGLTFKPNMHIIVDEMEQKAVKYGLPKDKNWVKIDFGYEYSQLAPAQQKLFLLIRGLMRSMVDNIDSLQLHPHVLNQWKLAKIAFDEMTLTGHIISTFTLAAVKSIK